MKRPTIRQRVINYALRHPLGFIDEDLHRMDPDAPESSIRKRRTELTDEGVILSCGDERQLNSKGQSCTVWRHRNHVLNPPPLRARVKKPSKLDELRSENAMLRAQAEQAAEQERAKVVSWFRRDQTQNRWIALKVAAMIERGEHLR